MKGPSSHLYLVILGLVLAASVSCKGGVDKQGTQAAASESKPAPADTGGSAAAAATATATTTAKASSEKPKTAPTVDSTVRATVDTADKGPTGEAALLGKPAPPKGPPAPMIPSGATAECHDSTYSLSQDKAFVCKGHGGVKHWLKP